MLLYYIHTIIGYRREMIEATINDDTVSQDLVCNYITFIQLLVIVEK